MLTPTECALLERLHRHMRDEETPAAESVSAAAARAIACVADWPVEGDWLVQNAEYIARYREDWEHEGQTVPLAVELDARSAAALRRLAAEMDWLLEDAARFAIRNLYDAYDDQVGLGEAAPAPVVQEAPAPVPPTALEPAPLPAPPSATEARPQRAEARAARDRRDEREPRPRAAMAEEPPKRRVSHKDISAEQELELIRRHQAGDRHAAAVLLQAHEPIIYQTVRRYFGKGLDLEDVLQAAREGFLHGISKFDASKGFRLATYATWWVRSYAQKALAEEGTTIVVGRSVDNQISSLKKSGQEIPARLLAARGLRSISHLDAPIGDESDGATLGDMTAGPDPGPETTAADGDAQARRRELITRAMTWLTPQEQEVVRRRILAEEPETLEELGASFERTRERIRQIEAKALTKLERALRKLMADDDAVLWGAEPPEGPARRRLPPLPPRAPAPTVPASPASEPAPSSLVFAAVEPPRAKQVAPPSAAPRLTPAQVAAVLPLRLPTRQSAGDDAWPLWERA